MDWSDSDYAMIEICGILDGWTHCCQSDNKSCIIRADGDIGVHANDLFDSCDCLVVLAGEHVGWNGILTWELSLACHLLSGGDGCGVVRHLGELGGQAEWRVGFGILI